MPFNAEVNNWVTTENDCKSSQTLPQRRRIPLRPKQIHKLEHTLHIRIHLEHLQRKTRL